jgi:hypothetical protein
MIFILAGCGGGADAPSATATPSGVIVTPDEYGSCVNTVSGKTMNILLVDTQGNQALLEFSGKLCGKSEGITLDGNLLGFKTQLDENKQYKIIHHEIVDGLLIITVEEGLFPILTEGRTLTPITREVKPATITTDGYWKGEASFIITGLNFNSATIYQDTRNYDIKKEGN